jgi:pimeloyl-ACP methyl ester carboxylesterase
MPASTRLFKSFTRLVIPVLTLVVCSVIAAAILLAQKAAHPPQSPYLVTPEKYGQLSSRGAQITDENWSNTDGTSSRGWLLRGAVGAPAVILLHAYGADRSYVLNLGVKLNEATDYTILMPDQRGHGEMPLAKSTSIGGSEATDAQAAIKYLRSLKAADGQTSLVGTSIGFYGTEMGALAAVVAAGNEKDVIALALDSVPNSSDDMLSRATGRRYPFASFVTTSLAKVGTNLYYYDRCYRREPLCETARTMADRQVLLLAGADAPEYQESTSGVGRCFPVSTRTEVKTDLNPSGFNIMNASLEQSDAYDQRVITFFKQALGPAPTLDPAASAAAPPPDAVSVK